MNLITCYAYIFATLVLRLRIFDGYNVDKQLTPPLGLYGIYLKDKYQRSGGNIHDYVSSGPAMTLYFMGEISRELFGFRVLITTFRGKWRSTSYCSHHMNSVSHFFTNSDRPSNR